MILVGTEKKEKNKDKVEKPILEPYLLLVLGHADKTNNVVEAEVESEIEEEHN